MEKSVFMDKNSSESCSDVIRQTKEENVDRGIFLRGLAELNTPETLIKNKSALMQFRKLKNRSAPLFRPRGIPEHQLKSEASSMDYEDSPTKKRTKATEQIAWVNRR